MPTATGCLPEGCRTGTALGCLADATLTQSGETASPATNAIAANPEPTRRTIDRLSTEPVRETRKSPVGLLVVPRYTMICGGARQMITMLVTDIEGSTRMLEGLGERYDEVVREHDGTMREAIAALGGREVHVAGDSFFAVFDRALDAVECAVRAQRAIAAARWPQGGRPRVRMGIHTGDPTPADGDFVGIDVHRAARVMAVALELARRIKFRSVVSQALVVQAIISLQREELERARGLIADAVQASSPYAIEPISILLAVTAAFAAATEQPTFAAQMWGAAEGARRRVRIEETPKYARLRERWQPVAMAALAGDATWDEAWKAGAALSLDDALAVANTVAGALRVASEQP